LLQVKLQGTEFVVFAATKLEELAIRSVISKDFVINGGIGLKRLPPEFYLEKMGISCGICGGLDPSIRSGTLVIPDQVVTESGKIYECDRGLQDRFRRTAEARGYYTRRGPMLTSRGIVAGKQREFWFAKGPIAVDMESSLVFKMVPTAGVVRVVFDTADHEISTDWSDVRKALRNPSNWTEALWLGIWGFMYTRKAALVIRDALLRGDQ